MLRNFEEQSGLLWTLFILTRATQSRFVLFYSLFHSSQFASGFPGVRSKHKAARKSPLRPSLDGGPQFPRACTWLVLGGLTQVLHGVMWSGSNKLLCVSNQGIWCFSSAWHMISLNVSFLPSTRQTRGSRSPGLTWGMDCPRLAKFIFKTHLTHVLQDGRTTTCTAGGGSLLLEFSLLSRLLGDPIYEIYARRAVAGLYARRCDDSPWDLINHIS